MTETAETTQLSFDFERVEPHIIGGNSDRNGGGNGDSYDEIKLELGAFAGPLDLLLFLIKQEQANIFDIPIARIADAYLQYIRLMKTLDVALAADFIVMAATLIEIKSKMLLPREIFGEAEEEFEDPRKELVDRLLEYEQYKNAAQMLNERSTVEQAIFRRGEIESDENNSEVSATVFDLFAVFEKIAARRKEVVQMEIKREEMSLAEMIRNLKRRIFAAGRLNLLEFFEGIQSRAELVLAFVAVLEIVRTESVILTQSETFGDIILRNADETGHG